LKIRKTGLNVERSNAADRVFNYWNGWASELSISRAELITPEAPCTKDS